MSTVQVNRINNLENEFIANAVSIDINGTVSIKYGYNSGGYESYQYFITKDGGTLAIQTVIDEIDNVDFNDEFDPQWYIVGVEVNYHCDDLYDSHTNKLIEPAYGDDYQSTPDDF